jgi:putative endonuclease
MFYVYVIANENNKIYIGRTNDLRRRIEEHNKGRNISTKGHQWRLVYYEAYRSEGDAVRRENNLKYHGQSKRWLKSRIVMSLKMM